MPSKIKKLTHKPKLDREINFGDAEVHLTAAVESSEGIDAKLPTFDIRAYNGGPLKVGNFRFPVIVDLAGMTHTTKSRPALLDHDTSKRIGHTTKVSISQNSVDIQGIVSSATPEAKEVVQSSMNGFPWQASVGLQFSKPVQYLAAGQTINVNGRDHSGPAYIASKSILKEISFTPLGVDDNTSARIAASLKEPEMDPKFAEWLEAKGFDADNITDGVKSSLQAIWEIEVPKSASKDTLKAAVVEGPTEDELRASQLKAAASTQKYISDVRNICAKFDNPEFQIGEGDKAKKVDLFAHAMENDWNTDKVELEATRASRPNLPAIHMQDQSCGSDVLEASLCLQTIQDEKFIGEQFSEETMNAAMSIRNRNIGIQFLMHECIRASGGYVHPGSKGDELIRAYEQNVLQAAAGPSTISLPGILSNVANKSALQSFLAVPTTWREFCRTRSMNDFKKHTSYRLTAAGTFSKVGKDGEIKAAELTEEQYENQLDTYGRRFAFTRQDIINDDLGMLDNIRALLGRQAALSLEEAVFTVLMDNTDNFFSVANKNLSTVALEIAGLTEVAQKFMDQTDQDGKPIILGADRLLVPTSLAVTAQQLFKDTTVVGQGNIADPVPSGNPHAGSYRPVPTPYLNSAGMPNSDPTDWYMFANPAGIAAMEVGFLNGVSSPIIESQQAAFEVLGVVFRGYFDFGVAKVDPRAAQKSEVV